MGENEDTVCAVDLFCGAGGLSTGLALACETIDRSVELAAVNHWGTAIETHKRNHPWAIHHNATVEGLHPPEALPGDSVEVDILVAAPECTHFSTARGGKPVNEQKRMSPWHVLDWLEKLDVKNILLENVREFESWGPVEDGTPTRNGEIFEAWVDSLHALGYSVDWQILNAADYGDATSRKRLFVVGRRGKRAAFPDPTHSENDTDSLESWRSASEIIDWSDAGDSIWGRSRPLVNNTMQRIAEGIRRHCHDDLTPYADAVASLGKADVETLQTDLVPVSDVAAVVEERDTPFLVKGTVLDSYSVSESSHCTPYLLGQHGGSRPRTVKTQPVPTIATRGAIGLYQPQTFVLPRNGAFRGLHSNATYDPANRPLHTVTAQNHDGHVVTPFCVRYSSERVGQAPRTYDIANLFPTVTATESDPHFVHPSVAEYDDNSSAKRLDEPLSSVTTTTTFALVVPECFPWGLDIQFRMLHPRELAAAMGFPADYEIIGNKTETTKQIGNAVPVNLARALCRQLLTGNEPSLHTFTEVRGECPGA